MISYVETCSELYTQVLLLWQKKGSIDCIILIYCLLITLLTWVTKTVKVIRVNSRRAQPFSSIVRTTTDDYKNLLNFPGQPTFFQRLDYQRNAEKSPVIGCREEYSEVCNSENIRLYQES